MSTSRRRLKAEELFKQAGVPAEFIYDGLYGDNRIQRIAEAKISLNLHLDGQHKYFGQHRILEAMAAGSIVVSEPSGQLDVLGVEEGKHIIIADIQDMPEICRVLLKDTEKRLKMIAQVQDLLRERYSPEYWLNEMSNMIGHY